MGQKVTHNVNEGYIKKGEKMKIFRQIFMIMSLMSVYIAECFYQRHLNEFIQTKKCENCVLSGATNPMPSDLGRVELWAADLRGSTFLRNVKMPGSDFRKADFSGADLSGADVSKSDFTGAKLIRANLRGTNFNGAVLRYGDFTDADFTQADLSGATSYSGRKCVEGSYGVCMIESEQEAYRNEGINTLKTSKKCHTSRGCYLYGADLRGIDLKGAGLAWSVLVNANLQGVDLRGANLSDALITNADFTGANLSGATWIDGTKCPEGSIGKCLTPEEEKIYIQNQIIKKLKETKECTVCDLKGVDLTGVDLREKDLRRADFSNAKLIDVKFTAADLREAVLIGADVTNADFKGANLTGATWTNGKKCGADSIGTCK